MIIEFRIAPAARFMRDPRVRGMLAVASVAQVGRSRYSAVTAHAPSTFNLIDLLQHLGLALELHEKSLPLRDIEP